MKYKEYKESISDIRALINDRGRLRSKFGSFTIDSGKEIYGVWNCLSKNVIVAINRRGGLLRVRRNSVYYPALSSLSNWKTIPSDTLAKYRDLGMNNHQNIYLNHVARPQAEKINALTEKTKIKIDFGKDEELRPKVADYIVKRVSPENGKKIRHDYNGDRFVKVKLDVKSTSSQEQVSRPEPREETEEEEEYLRLCDMMSHVVMTPPQISRLHELQDRLTGGDPGPVYSPGAVYSATNMTWATQSVTREQLEQLSRASNRSIPNHYPLWGLDEVDEDE